MNEELQSLEKTLLSRYEKEKHKKVLKIIDELVKNGFSKQKALKTCILISLLDE